MAIKSVGHTSAYRASQEFQGARLDDIIVAYTAMFSGMKWLTTRGYMPPLSLYYRGIVHVDVAAEAAGGFSFESGL